MPTFDVTSERTYMPTEAALVQLSVTVPLVIEELAVDQ